MVTQDIGVSALLLEPKEHPCEKKEEYLKDLYAYVDTKIKQYVDKNVNVPSIKSSVQNQTFLQLEQQKKEERRFVEETVAKKIQENNLKLKR